MKLNVQLSQKMVDEGYLRDLVLRLRSVIDNGRMGFGDLGSEPDNIFGKFILFNTPATPDTDIILDHNLGTLPMGFLVFGMVGGGGVIYNGVTAWTTTQISLRCNLPNILVKVFILGQSNQGS